MLSWPYPDPFPFETAVTPAQTKKTASLTSAFMASFELERTVGSG
jgi:hypothetical protein